MVYTTICGESVARIALGTAPFGAGVDRDTAFAVMDAYYEQGGNLLDTARIYAGGVSEQVVGEWIRERGVREHVYVSTKGAHPDFADWLPRINERELKKDLEESLRALCCDCVDVYYLHRDDVEMPVSEIMPLLHRFVTAGKVRFLGASNWTVQRIDEANRFACENGLTPFSYSQILWNHAQVNKEGVPDQTLVVMDETEHEGYRRNGLPVMAYTSQAQGLFSLIANGGFATLSPTMRATYDNETTRQRAEQVLAISRDTGLSPTAVALGRLLQDEVTALPIIGTSRVERVTESLQALRLCGVQG